MADDRDWTSRVAVGLHHLQSDAIDEVTDLHRGQQARRRLRDDRLPRLSDMDIRRDVERLAAAHPAVIASVDGAVYASAFPAVEIYRPDDDGRAYFQRECGVAYGLAVRDGSPAGRAALAAILRHVMDWWRNAQASGGKLEWPVADFDITKDLALFGIVPDAYIKHRSNEPPGMVAGQGGTSVAVRLARSDDLAAAVALNSMVLAEHVSVSPFARWDPDVEDRFRRRFMTAVDRSSGAGLFFVAEVDGQVAAMAECEIETPKTGLDATFNTAKMGYVHVFGVEVAMRRRRVGTALAAYVLDELTARGMSGVRLIVSHYNGPSRAFWRHIGFSDAWRLYQTHDLAVS